MTLDISFHYSTVTPNKRYARPLHSEALSPSHVHLENMSPAFSALQPIGPQAQKSSME